MAKVYSEQFIPLQIAVLTVSDSRTEATDTSGQLLVERLTAAGHRLAEKRILRDDLYRIRAQVAAMIMAHQEKVDGTGYPQGLCGEEIPLGARILAVVDAYDAMTSDRIYRDARSHGEAMDELLRLGGQHFDAEVVDAFAEVLKAEIPARKAFGRKGSGYPGNGNGRHSTPGTIPSGEQTARLLSPRSGKGPLK